MEMIFNARKIWSKLWSIRLALVSACLSATEVAMAYIAPSAPSGRFAMAAFIVAIAAAIARIVAQPALHNGDE